MSRIVKITRRDFLRHTGVGAGALVLGCYISPKGLFAAGLPDLPDLIHNGSPLNNFVAIVPVHGTIIIMAHRSEMGQGIRSSLAAVLADELEADWDKVRVHQADADGPRFAIEHPVKGGAPSFLIPDEGSQFADSSRSMAAYFKPMRLFGAGIRLVMVRAAARHFGVDPADCEAQQHKVLNKRSGKSIAYGDPLLLLQAKKVAEHPPTVEEVTAALKSRKQWRFIGGKMPFVDVQDMVTGKAVYGADVDPKRPGMLTAMIVRCPVANGAVKSFDASAALAVPGVKSVVEVLPKGFPGGGVGAGFIPHAGVAVLAENTWAALQGRRALKVEWDLGPNATYDSKAYRGELEASTNEPGKTLRSKGDVDGAFGAASKVVEGNYYVPHLAQAPMEPPTAVALYDNGHWEIWSPTQGPELAQHYVGLAMMEPTPANQLRGLAWQAADPSDLPKEILRKLQRQLNEELEKLLGVDQAGLFKIRDDLKKEIRDKVKVHVTLLGGGFGRKSKPDYAVEAAFLARQHPGVPIRVQWTREDDIKFSYYNAVSHQHLKAALGADGKATALLQRSAFTSFFATLFAPNEIAQLARAAYHNGGKDGYGSGIERAHGLEDMLLDVPNVRIENCPAQNHIRVGWMRSVANIYHAFGICSFADEMAIAAGRDSKDYLLELIGTGVVLDEKAFQDQGVECFDNNGFPVDTVFLQGPDGKPVLGPDQKLIVGPDGKSILIMPPYPPDGRRLRAVVERVAKESGWDEKVKKYKGIKGRGLGIAAHRSFLSYVAVVIDVSLNEANELTIHDIYAAIDCGIAVNPDRVNAQMQGGIIYGLSYALLGEITVKNGAVEQNNFDDYPVLRIHQTPKNICTYVEDPSAEVASGYPGGEVPPTGVGEPPTPAVAPALANAIVAAGGPRIREIPFYKKIVVG
jgi:isoquinoline 1-oxidoreductase subunit beta